MFRSNQLSIKDQQAIARLDALKEAGKPITNETKLVISLPPETMKTLELHARIRDTSVEAVIEQMTLSVFGANDDNEDGLGYAFSDQAEAA